MPHLIDLSNIHKSYQIGEQIQHVLQGANLQVDKGQLVSVMGQSGSGKSTIMNMIGLLDKPDKGEYFLDGDEIKNLSPNELAAIRNKKIGFVFQSFFLLPKLTAVQNVALPLMYRGMSQSESHERSLKILKEVGMDKWADHKPLELSGGQQQRVAIARALVGKPDIILADEPTGALDPNIGKEILELFIGLNEKEGTTLLIITHDPKVAERCKIRYVMGDGHLKLAS